MEGQTAAEQGQARWWLLLPETRRSGRRSQPLELRSRGGALTTLLAVAEGTGRRWSSKRRRGRAAPTPLQRPGQSQVGGDQWWLLYLGHNDTQYLLVKEETLRTRRHRKGTALCLRYRNLGTHQQRITVLSENEGGTGCRGTSRLGQRRRGWGQGCIEERRVSWKPSRFSIAKIPGISQRDLEVISSWDRNNRSSFSISEKEMEPQRFDPTALAPANCEKDELTASEDA